MHGQVLAAGVRLCPERSKTETGSGEGPDLALSAEARIVFLREREHFGKSLLLCLAMILSHPPSAISHISRWTGCEGEITRG